MASKKLARQTSIIGGGKHGRRRARPHVTRAATRDLRWVIYAAIVALAVIGVLVFRSGTAGNRDEARQRPVAAFFHRSPRTRHLNSDLTGTGHERLGFSTRSGASAGLDLPTMESSICDVGNVLESRNMITLQVSNMTCGGCAKGVTRAVQGVDRHASVEIDLAKRLVAVRSSESASSIVEALTRAGFQATPQTSG